MNKKPSKYDSAIFAPPKIETDPAEMQRSILASKSHDTIDSIAASIASEVREWLGSSEPKSKAATDTGEALLHRCETIRQDLGPIEESGIRKGPPSPASLVDFGYHHCQWRIQAYGHERFAGMGRESDSYFETMRKVRYPITQQAVSLFDAGTSIRQVAEVCGVKKNVAERWQKEHRKKTKNI